MLSGWHNVSKSRARLPGTRKVDKEVRHRVYLWREQGVCYSEREGKIYIVYE